MLLIRRIAATLAGAALLLTGAAATAHATPAGPGIGVSVSPDPAPGSCQAIAKIPALPPVFPSEIQVAVCAP